MMISVGLEWEFPAYGSHLRRSGWGDLLPLEYLRSINEELTKGKVRTITNVHI
jgi:hypothetical protein